MNPSPSGRHAAPTRAKATDQSPPAQSNRVGEGTPPSDDTVAPVPVTLWLPQSTHTHDRGDPPTSGTDPRSWSLPPGIGERIVSSFSHPGQLTVTVDAPTNLLAAAAAGARRVLDLRTTRSVPRLRSELREAIPATRRAAVRTRLVPPDQLAEVLRGSPATVDLVVLQPVQPPAPEPAAPVPAADESATPESPVAPEPAVTPEPVVRSELIGATAVALRPGGLMVAVIDNPEPVDSTTIQTTIETTVESVAAGLAGKVVHAATEVGLAYLQHIVALTTPTMATAVAPSATLVDVDEGGGGDPRGGEVCAHERIHLDLLLFGSLRERP
jgi:hypothetical protein